MKRVIDVFDTSVGTLEVRVDEESRIVSIYRFNDQHRAVAAAMDNWDYVDLVDVLTRQVRVPEAEADRIATYLRDKEASLDSQPERRRGSMVRKLILVMRRLAGQRAPDGAGDPAREQP
jgi:hypothetical protein